MASVSRWIGDRVLALQRMKEAMMGSVRCAWSLRCSRYSRYSATTGRLPARTIRCTSLTIRPDEGDDCCKVENGLGQAEEENQSCDGNINDANELVT